MASTVVGSNPLVGSSRNKIAGVRSIALAKAKRFVIPFDKFITNVFFASNNPTSFNIDSIFLSNICLFFKSCCLLFLLPSII